MKKVLCIVFVVALAVAGTGAYMVKQQRPIEVTVSPPLDENGNIHKDDSYVYQVLIASHGIDGKEEERATKVFSDLKQFYSDFYESYKAPYMVEAKYENIDGKTVITFCGQATHNASDSPETFEKKFVYDFCLTDTIHTREDDTLIYFK